MPLSGLDITTCRFAFRLRRKAVRRDVAKTLFYRQLLHVSSVFVQSGGLHVRVERRFVSLMRELMGLPSPLGCLLDVAFSSPLSGPEALKLLSQFLMPSS